MRRAENTALPGPQKPSLFSPQKRQRVLDRLLVALQTDHRIAGVLIVGSGAVGFKDAFSDIDLTVVVGAEEDVLPVFQEWRGRVEDLFTILHHFETIYGPNNYLYGVLLDGFLEVDVGFVCLANLTARRARWKIAFDRSGKIDDIMRASWAQRPQLDVHALYLSYLDSIWYYITHGVIALQRGRAWMALHQLEQVRNQTVKLIGLRRGLETRHFRQVDEMSEDLLDELEQTLSSTDATDLMRALKAATTCFFREARGLDQALGLDAARGLERKMQAYLDLFAGQV